MEKQNINTIYQYTESHIKAQEESLNRIDARFSTFIGFSGVLIRLALDLPDTCLSTAKILTCVFAVAAIVISSIGLTSKNTGKVIHPKALMKDQHFEQDEIYHQCFIVNDRLDLIQECENLFYKKGKRLNRMIILFTLATIFFGIGVSGLDIVLATWFHDIYLQLFQVFSRLPKGI